MSRLSDFSKFYNLSDATAQPDDIAEGRIAYIRGGRVIGSGTAPTGSTKSYYSTSDGNAVPFDVTGGKTFYNKHGKQVGVDYGSGMPASGSIVGLDSRPDTLTPTNDIFVLIER